MPRHTPHANLTKTAIGYVRVSTQEQATEGVSRGGGNCPLSTPVYPNIAALLDSSIRPARWPMSFEDGDYDPDAVGWRTQGSGDTYDTAEPGYSNAGRTYADALSPNDRRALLEYLKTL